MKLVDQNTRNAWRRDLPLTISSNTKIKRAGDTLQLFLHGNLIAEKDSYGNTRITDCGWGTSVTSRRLTAVACERVSFSKGEFCLFRGEPINNKWVKV